MAKKKKKTPEEMTQSAIASIVVHSEYRNAATMADLDNRDFESLVDMLEGKRNEKDYEWMSDYTIPELVSIIQTNASGWAAQYFPTRDFVEVKLDGDNPTDEFKTRAAKKLLNKILNDKDLYYYHKYIRLRLINALFGKTYALCWWEQELRSHKITRKRPVRMNHDIYGNPLTDLNTQQPAVMMQEYEDEIYKPVVDRFNFEVIDPRNIFMDNKYCYSLQQKDWITIRSELSYSDLKAKEKEYGYFNLDKVKNALGSIKKTETADNTYAKNEESLIDKTPVQYMDVIDRYGKFWAIVTERDADGNPKMATPGIDERGMPLDNAELIESIITFAFPGNSEIMIRFEPTSYIDANGKPFKPIVRGLCYIHPVKDTGLSDGKNAKELQIAINDNFNMALDRVKLATLPTFKGKKDSLDDNSSVYFEPEHVIELNDPDDLQEVVVKDNINGAMDVHGMLTNKLNQVTATFPNTMGDVASKASATATAVAGAESRTNVRENYKSLTFEYSFLTEFYWMILQLSYRFAHEDTLLKLMGEDARYFDAKTDYTYSPLSSNIEQEYNKYRKIQLYDQSIGRISGLAKSVPEVIPIIAMMIGSQLELLGNEFPKYGNMLKQFAQAKVRPEGGEEGSGGGGVPQIKDMKEAPQVNQSGMPMTGMEIGTRNAAMAHGGMIR